MRHDLWFALRRLRLRPLHSLVIALTLGLGIGAALAVFAVVDAVLLRPLPYANASRLVRVTRKIPVLRDYKFVQLDDRILIVRPDDRVTVSQIPRYRFLP